MWFESIEILTALQQCEERLRWEEQAEQVHASLTLEPRFQQPDRVGYLKPGNLPATGELVLWVYPVDRSKVHGILMGPKHQICLLSESGSILFDGVWAELPYSLVQQNPRSFIWVAPPVRKGPSKSWKVKKPLWLRLFSK